MLMDLTIDVPARVVEPQRYSPKCYGPCDDPHDKTNNVYYDGSIQSHLYPTGSIPPADATIHLTGVGPVPLRKVIQLKNGSYVRKSYYRPRSVAETFDILYRPSMFDVPRAEAQARTKTMDEVACSKKLKEFFSRHPEFC